MSDPTLTFQLRPDSVEWRPIEGEIVAVDLRSSVYFAVSPAGAIIWPELATGATRSALVERLAQSCEIGTDQAGKEVDDFLASLAELDLLEP